MPLPSFSGAPTIQATQSAAGKSRQFFYNAKDYGATGNGSTDDTAALNSVLTAINTAGGGHAYLPAGTYVISAPLVIYSNTFLELDPDATVSLAASSNCNMLIDAAHSTGSGSVSNITVKGGTWNRNANSGTGTSLMTMILGGDYLTVDSVQFLSAAGKYSLAIQNATHYTVNNLYFNNVFSDCVHVQGPAAYGKITNIRAVTPGDDVVALTPMDWTAYAIGSGGNITDTVIDTVSTQGQTIANIVKVLGGTNGGTVYTTSHTIVRNITGTFASTGIHAVWIGDDTGQANTSNGQVNDVSVSGIAVSLPNASTDSLINIAGSSTSLTIPSIRISDVTLDSDFGSVISSSAKVNNLLLNGVTGKTASAGPTAIVSLSNTNMSTNRLEISNVAVVFTGTQTGSLVKDSTASTTLTELFVSNIFISNNNNVFDLITTTNVYIAGLRTTSNAVIFNIRTGAVIVVQGCTGLNAQTATHVVTSTGTLESKSPNFPMDITGAQIVAAKGDMAYNTASGASTGIGPVAYNGSAWQPMALTQSLYSTSSPTFAKINITTGSNANAGTGTLTGGTVTISTTAVTASSLIFLQDTASSITNVGTLTVSSKSAGTSFTVTSTLALDTSTFNWLIVN
jgi:hypothetical protein